MSESRDEEVERLRTALDLTPDLVFFLDRGSLTILDANEAACRMLGYRREELVGMEAPCVVQQASAEELVSALDAAIQAWPGVVAFRTSHRARDGLGIPVIWLIRAVKRGPVLVVVATPVGPSRGFDSLTGLPDRRQFEGRLLAALAAASQRPEQSLAVLFIDLDGFKAINDTFGHLAGDRLLCEMVGRLSRCVRAGDLLARYGGDEFVVLLDALHGQEDAIRVAQRIATTLEAPACLEGREVRITASIGIAMGPRHYRSPEEMLHDADRAMYRAKAIGKARYAVFGDDDAS